MHSVLRRSAMAALLILTQAILVRVQAPQPSLSLNRLYLNLTGLIVDPIQRTLRLVLNALILAV